MVFRNSVLKSLYKRAILTKAWILGSIVKLQFDKGEIYFWLTVKSLLINTLNHLHLKCNKTCPTLFRTACLFQM